MLKRIIRRMAVTSMVLSMVSAFSACAHSDRTPISGAPSTPSTPSAAPSESSPGGSGGGYADRNAQTILSFVASNLSQFILGLSDNALKLPPGWDNARVAGVIQNVENHSGENRQQNGRFLDFYYDQKRSRIFALAPFYTSYGSIPSPDNADFFQLLGVEAKLLHEVSHLWGNNEAQADQFSEMAIAAIRRNNLVCQFYKPPEIQGNSGAFLAVYNFSFRVFLPLPAYDFSSDLADPLDPKQSEMFSQISKLGDDKAVDANGSLVIDSPNVNDSLVYDKRTGNAKLIIDGVTYPSTAPCSRSP